MEEETQEVEREVVHETTIEQPGTEPLTTTETATETVTVPTPEPTPDRSQEILDRLDTVIVLLTPVAIPEEEVVEVVEEPAPMKPKRRSFKR